MVQGHVFLYGGVEGGGQALFLFNFFKAKVYHLLYPLQNCAMHLKKKFFLFSATIIL